MNNQFDHLIRKYSTDIPPRFVKGMIHVESAFRPDARGPGGELGLMQFLPSTAKTLGVQHDALRDPETAIRYGTRYLSEIVSKYINPHLKAPIDPLLKVKLAQFAYNAGPLFTVRLLKRFGGDVLSNPSNFDRMVETLRGDPDIARLARLTKEADFLSARKKVVEKYQYWADRYAGDFPPAPGAPPKPAAAALTPPFPGGLALAALAASAILWVYLRRNGP